MTAAGTVSVDARMRARRVDVLRAQGRRRLRRLLVGVALLGALAVVWVAAIWSPVLRVRHLRVDGVEGQLRVDVERAAKPILGSALVTADTGALEAALRGDPRVAAARVSKEPPGTIRVAVARRIPVAQASVAGGYAVMAADGVVIEVRPAPDANLALLLAVAVPAEPGADAIAASGALHALSALPASVAARVRQVQAGDGGALTMLLDDGARVDFGPPDGAVRKGQVLEALMVDTAARGAAVLAYNVISPEVPAVTSKAPA